MSTITSILNLLQLQCSQTAVVTRAGAFYKARYAGHSEFVFGATAEDALRNLRSGRLGRNNPIPIKKHKEQYANQIRNR